MPFKANDVRRHKIPRARYKVTNWPEYDRALRQRGSLTVWVTPEALAAWHPPRTGQPGRPRDYSDVAIETGHLLRLAFDRPWRQTGGLLRSLVTLLGMSVGVPDHTTFSRCSPRLGLATSLAQAQASGPVHVVIDAIGLKVFGAGEWLVEMELPTRRQALNEGFKRPYALRRSTSSRPVEHSAVLAPSGTLRAGAAVRIPGHRLRAALSCKPVGTKRWSFFSNQGMA